MKTRSPGSSLEPLEERIAPAVVAAVQNGVLTITGDSNSNAINVTELATPGSYHVTGLSAGAADFAGVSSILANLDAGTDSLVYDGIAAPNTGLPGNLTVNASGSGFTTVQNAASIGGTFTLNHTGAGDFSLQVTGSQATLGAIVYNDSGTGNASNVSVTGARVLNGLSVSTKVSLSMGIVGGASVSGGVSVHGGAATESLSLLGSRISGGLTFDAGGSGSATISFNQGFLAGNLSLFNLTGDGTIGLSNGSAVAGTVQLTASGNGNRQVILNNSAIGPVALIVNGPSTGSATLASTDSSVVGNAVVQSQASGSIFFSNSNLFGSLSATLGGSAQLSSTSARILGATTLDFHNATLSGISLLGAQLGGPVNIIGSLAASDGITFVQVLAGSSITVTDGGGGATFGLTATYVPGAVTFVGSSASDSFGANQLRVDGALSINLAGGTSNTVGISDLVVLGNVTLQASSGTNTFSCGPGFVGGQLVVLGGNDKDSTSLSGLRVASSVLVGLSNGENALSASNVLSGGILGYAGGSGNDVVSWLGVQTAGLAGALLGSGTDSLALANSRVGQLALFGDAGSQTISVGSSQILGATNIALGAGANSMTVVSSYLAASLTFASGDDGSSLTVSSSYLASALTFTAGTAADTLDAADSIFVGAINFFAGQGANKLAIENRNNDNSQGTLVVGPLLFVGGADGDTVTLSSPGNDRATFFSSVTLQGGAGTNTFRRGASLFYGPAPATTNFVEPP